MKGYCSQASKCPLSPLPPPEIYCAFHSSQVSASAVFDASLCVPHSPLLHACWVLGMPLAVPGLPFHLLWFLVKLIVVVFVYCGTNPRGFQNEYDRLLLIIGICVYSLQRKWGFSKSGPKIVLITV